MYSVPFATVNSYTERSTLSREIEERLDKSQSRTQVPHALFIHGLGGTGKSQLALKYAQDHRKEFNPILWIDAKDEKSVRSSFGRCAIQLGLQIEQTYNQTSKLIDSPVVIAVRRWLQERTDLDEEWLFIVDNADDQSWGIKWVLPDGPRGRILITSQDRKALNLINGSCEEMSIGMMDLSQTRKLLLKHLGLNSDSMLQNVLENCDKVSDQLGYLPLAVDLAGAYVANAIDRQEALRYYLVDYSKHQDYLLRSEHYRGLSPNEKTVWTVWDTTLARIKVSHPESGMFLGLIARFRGSLVQEEMFRLASHGIALIRDEFLNDNEEVPSWLAKLLAVEDQEWQSFYYRDICTIFVRYSLLQKVDGEWPGLTMHDLVRWRAIKDNPTWPWDFWYLFFMAAAGTEVTAQNAQPHFRRHFVTHMPELGIESVNRAEVLPKQMPLVLRTFALIYHHTGRLKEAEELGRQVIETRKQILGDEHPDTLMSMNDLVWMYWSQGRFKEGEELGTQVVKIRKKVLGEEHPDTLMSLNNLVTTYKNQGRLKEAESLGIQVVETKKKVLGDEHPDTLISLNNLSTIYRNQGRLEESEEIITRVVQTRKKVLGDKHPRTLISINDLASTYRTQGRWEEAEKLGVQVMETRKKILGDEHPDTLLTINNLATTYGNQGRWEEAEKLHSQVIKIRKKILGNVHPDMLISMHDLASTYRNQGRWEEAEKLGAQVLETRNKILGNKHPRTLITMNELALTYWNQGRRQEAKELMESVIHLQKEIIGSDHPHTKLSIYTLTSWIQS